MYQLVALFGFMVLPLTQAQLTINSPSASSVVVCQPMLLTWSGGTPPYMLSIVTPGNADTLETLSADTSETQLTWLVDQPVGENMNFAIKDATGAQQFTATTTVLDNTDHSCLAATGSDPTTTKSTTSTKSTTTSSSSSTSASVATDTPIDTHTSDPGKASDPGKTSTTPPPSGPSSATASSNRSGSFSKASTDTGASGTPSPSKSGSASSGSSATVLSGVNTTTGNTISGTSGTSSIPDTSTSAQSSPSGTTLPTHHSPPVAAIAGGAVAGVLLLSVGVALCLLRRRKRRRLGTYDTRTILDKEDLDGSPSTQSLATGEVGDLRNQGTSTAGPTGHPEDLVAASFVPRKARLDRGVLELPTLEDTTHQPLTDNETPIESERERTMQHQMEALQAEVHQLRAALVMDTASIPPAYEGPPDTPSHRSVVTNAMKSSMG